MHRRHAAVKLQTRKLSTQATALVLLGVPAGVYLYKVCSPLYPTPITDPDNKVAIPGTIVPHDGHVSEQAHLLALCPAGFAT